MMFAEKEKMNIKPFHWNVENTVFEKIPWNYNRFESSLLQNWFDLETE